MEGAQTAADSRRPSPKTANQIKECGGKKKLNPNTAADLDPLMNFIEFIYEKKRNSRYSFYSHALFGRRRVSPDVPDKYSHTLNKRPRNFEVPSKLAPALRRRRSVTLPLTQRGVPQSADSRKRQSGAGKFESWASRRRWSIMSWGENQEAGEKVWGKLTFWHQRDRASAARVLWFGASSAGSTNAPFTTADMQTMWSVGETLYLDFAPIFLFYCWSFSVPHQHDVPVSRGCLC